MTRLLALGIIALIGPCAGAEVRIDAFLDPADEAYLGQPVRLVVLVETDTWFVTAPRYPEIQVPGAIVLQPDTFGVNVSRREGGTTWTGQRQRYLIFPQRTGQLTIPPFRVSLAVAETGSGTAGPVEHAATPPVTTRVIAPPGAEGIDSFVTAPSYRIVERWEGEMDLLVAGNAVTREVTQTAGDTFALLLPVPEFEGPSGVAVYPAPPVLDDRTNRGSYAATRTDTVTYVLEEPGTFALPAISVNWFDLGSGRMRTEILPERILEVGAGASSTSDAGASPEAEPGLNPVMNRWLNALVTGVRDNLVLLTIAAAAAWLLWQIWRRFRGPIEARWRTWRDQRRLGEPARFARARSAAHQGDGDAFVNAFWDWSDHLPGRRPPLQAPVPPGEDTDLWRSFLEARYGNGTSSTVPDGLGQALIRLRRSWLSRDVPADREPDRLNP